MSRRRQGDTSSLPPVVEFRCRNHPTKRGPRAGLTRDREVGPVLTRGKDARPWRWKIGVDGGRWLTSACPTCERPFAWSEDQVLDALTTPQGALDRVRTILY